MNKYSFKDILSKEIIIEEQSREELTTSISILFQKIEIPMIQRDYVQGRANESEVRKTFLDSIFNALRKSESLDMDFIYGSVWESNDKKFNAFIPLDGQQRLTTLFLLYWYIGSRELEISEWNKLKMLLLKFTYSTRSSSRKFCKKLSQTKLLFSKSPKEEITDLSWFYKSFERDLTIKSMLVMLDAIHQRYCENDKVKLYANLENLQFYVLPLNGFNLSEELYIKMNARGKQLTDFENFKADLTKWMMDEKSDNKVQFQEIIQLHDRAMPYYLSFSEKIDTIWTSSFWNITKNYDEKQKNNNGIIVHPEGKIVDPLFMRFFRRYLLNKFILKSQKSNDKIGDETEYQLLSGESRYQNFDIFRTLFSDGNTIKDVERILDQLFSNWGSINQAIQSPWKDKLTILESSITQQDRIVFLSITSYLEQFNYEEKSFKQWMRTVWNIVKNTDINAVSSMISTIKVINELSLKADCIYEYLANNEIPVSSSKDALNEEKIKSSFICKNEDWETIFINAEAHLFFKGCISFLISEGMTANDFNHRFNIASKVFDDKGISAEFIINHIFLRALISRFKNYNDIIWSNFTDRDESEHYLKKMLASNKIVRNYTIQWFSLIDEKTLMTTLKKVVTEDSQMPGWDQNDINTQNRIRKVHEALYKTPDLQLWMQQNKACRVGWRDNHIFISKPSAWYRWVMLDCYRNEIIECLVRDKHFDTENKCTYSKDQKEFSIPFFWGGDSIEVLGILGNEELKFTFDRWKDIKIEKKNNNEWTLAKEYNYVDEVSTISDILPFINKIEIEVSNKNN